MRSQDEDNLKMLREINNNTVTQIEHDLAAVPPSASPQPKPALEQEPHDHDHHDHSHSHHNHGQKHGKQSNKKPGQKNYLIILYTTFTCLSCWYLETQHLNPYLGDFRALLMTYLTWFDVVMCLWSYFQTIRISPSVQKMPLRDRNPYNLSLKQCPNCNYMKPPRVSHCSTCGKCIYKLDHHCIWTQTCIGFANQRSFYLFCFYMSIGVIQFWYSTARTASILLDGCHFFEAFEPGVYILWGITCFSAGFVGMMIVGLAIGHTMMIMTNFTTLDSLKSKRTCPIPFFEFRKNQLDPKSINAWDRGEIQNLKSLFGTNILTFWMPLARQIDNEFLFEAMTPTITPLNPRQILNVPSAQIKLKLSGQTFKINDQLVQL